MAEQPKAQGTRAYATACPLPVEADVQPFGRHSGFDPLRKSGGQNCCDAQRRRLLRVTHNIAIIGGFARAICQNRNNVKCKDRHEQVVKMGSIHLLAQLTRGKEISAKMCRCHIPDTLNVVWNFPFQLAVVGFGRVSSVLGGAWCVLTRGPDGHYWCI
jgi:hypothetical protein